MALKRFAPVLACALCAFLLPPILAATKTAYLLTQLTMSAYYVLASLGLCALMGYAGQISLGQAGFFAIGAYASSFLATLNLTKAAASPGRICRGCSPRRWKDSAACETSSRTCASSPAWTRRTWTHWT